MNFRQAVSSIAATVAITLSGCSSQLVLPLYTDIKYKEALSEDTLSIQYLGVGGHILSYKGTQIMTAPSLSNPHFLFAGPFFPMSPDEEEIDQYLPDVSNVEMLLVGHGHYDHMLDVPYVMQKHAKKAHIYGSDTIARIMKPAIDSSRIHGLNDVMADSEKPGEWVYGTSGKVRIMAIKSDHAPHIMGLKLIFGEIDEDLEELPWHGFGWKEGQTLAYVIDFLEEDKSVEKWHDDVQFFNISRQGKLIASFYLDLFARNKKRGGAWMDDCRARRATDHGLQLPVAYLTCNFTPPVGDTPALLTHDEVVTLFHEFGHGLHHMLSKIEVASVSGINGVPWDAVELPSQFLENWCWEKSVVPLISGHYETGEVLPSSLLNKLLEAKNFQSGMAMVRQLEFALFDFRLHRQYNPNDVVDPQEVLDKVRNEVAVVKPPAFNKFQNGFGHIFAGGYAAGYYSYKWAEVLSADAFSLFEEEGVFNKATGEKFLTEILERGGSEEPMTLFKRFRGREPEIGPLLRHSGISTAA